MPAITPLDGPFPPPAAAVEVEALLVLVEAPDEVPSALEVVALALVPEVELLQLAAEGRVTPR